MHWFYETAVLLHELLAETGALYVHLDYHGSFYAKAVLDEVFGADRFVNEVVWKRQTAKGDVTQGAMHMGGNKVNRLSVELDQSLRRLYRARELLASLFELKASYPSAPGNSTRMIGFWAELSAIAVYLQERYEGLGRDFRNKKDALGPTMVSPRTFAVYDAEANRNTPEFDAVMELFELIEKMIDLELRSPSPVSIP